MTNKILRAQKIMLNNKRKILMKFKKSYSKTWCWKNKKLTTLGFDHLRLMCQKHKIWKINDDFK